MSEALSTGKGRCQGTARLLIRPLQAVVELGAAGDVVAKMLNAVHHANRHGSIEDFIAVALPDMHMARNGMVAGNEIELIGSDTSLTSLLKHDGINTLLRRGMINGVMIEETWCDAGLQGSAWVRDRACEKHTPGWIRRTEARAARRGKSVGKAMKPRGFGGDMLTLVYGKTPINLREVIGIVSDGPMMVSTYGFSSPNTPAILPVQSIEAQKRNAAA
jgi:hypothetical protein